MGYGSVHHINVSAAHPATFSKTLNSFIKKQLLFSGIPRPSQILMKIPGFLRIWSPWLFNHFSVRGTNLKPCKTQNPSQRQYKK